MQEQVTERMLIRGAPDQCYAVLTQFEDYPQWAADIKSVHIDERDAQGNAALVTFRAAAFGRSTSLTLRYDYSEAPGKFSWNQERGDITRRYDGSYELLPSGDGGTEVVYTLVVDLVVPLPGFVKRRAEGRITSTALRELKARVESAGAPQPATEA